MKHLLLSTLVLAGLAGTAQAQTGGVGVGTATPNAAAALDITAADKGLLIPRLDSAARIGISTPPAGLMVYQTAPRAGFYYYSGTAWVFIPDKARAGDNLGNHSATQALTLNGNQLRLRTSSDNNHALLYGSTYDGPLLYGYGGGALGYTSDGTTVTPALRWTRNNNVSVGLAGTNAGTGPDLSFGGAGYGEGIGSARATGSSNLYGLDFYTSSIKRLTIGNGGTVSVGVAGTNTGTAPDLAFGGSGTGEGIGSARSSGNPNQYGIDFYTGFNKRLSISNTGNVGVAVGNTTPSSTLQVAGTVAVGVARNIVGNSQGTRLGSYAASYLLLSPAAGADYYLLPNASTCPGRVYYVRNTTTNAAGSSTPSRPAYIGVEAGSGIADAADESNYAGPVYTLYAGGSTKTVTIVSDGVSWTVIRAGNAN